MPQFCPECGALIRRVDATFCVKPLTAKSNSASGLGIPFMLHTGTICLSARPELLTLAAFTIGRDPAQNQLPLNHPTIGRVYARVAHNCCPTVDPSSLLVRRYALELAYRGPLGFAKP